MSDTNQYEVDLYWDKNRKGTLSSPEVLSKIEVTTPPGFPGGEKEIWTPEHLFVAAVNACLMATFLSIAENSKLEFRSFECTAIGTVIKEDNKYRVSEIAIKPKIVITTSESAERAKRILEMSETNCAIARSINTKIILVPIIKIR